MARKRPEKFACGPSETLAGKAQTQSLIYWAVEARPAHLAFLNLIRFSPDSGNVLQFNCSHKVSLNKKNKGPSFVVIHLVRAIVVLVDPQQRCQQPLHRPLLATSASPASHFKHKTAHCRSHAKWVWSLLGKSKDLPSS